MNHIESFNCETYLCGILIDQMRILRSAWSTKVLHLQRRTFLIWSINLLAFKVSSFLQDSLVVCCYVQVTVLCELFLKDARCNCYHDVTHLIRKKSYEAQFVSLPSWIFVRFSLPSCLISLLPYLYLTRRLKSSLLSLSCFNFFFKGEWVALLNWRKLPPSKDFV